MEGNSTLHKGHCSSPTDQLPQTLHHNRQAICFGKILSTGTLQIVHESMIKKHLHRPFTNTFNQLKW